MNGSCGYHLVGYDSPLGIKTISVVPFVEEEPLGLSADLTAALCERLASEGLILTTNRAEADGVVVGRVYDARSASSASNTRQIQVFQLIAKVEAQLKDKRGQKVWSKTITLEESFLPYKQGGANGALGTDANRRLALRRFAKEAARRLHSAFVIDRVVRPMEES